MIDIENRFNEVKELFKEGYLNEDMYIELYTKLLISIKQPIKNNRRIKLDCQRQCIPRTPEPIDIKYY
jgi:hypothetical protein